MKIAVWGLTLSCLSAFYLLSCTKHSDSAAGASAGSHTGARTGTLVFSGSKVQKGQPLLVSLSGGTSTAIRWSVAANPGNVHVVAAKDQAMILFARPGTYRVTASSLGADSSATDSSWGTISVTDTVYQPVPPPAYDTTTLAGDQITITPSVDSNANLFLLAQTKNSYGCASTLIYEMSAGGTGGGGIGLTFYEVVSNGTGPCNGVQNPASAFLFPGATSTWPIGTYPVTARLNGITYTGTLTITNTTYTFSWNYSSGVLISPLQLNK